MNRGERQDESYGDDVRNRGICPKGLRIWTVGAIVILTATCTPSVFSVAQVHGYVGPTGLPHAKIRYHRGAGNLELEQAVIRAAQQHRVQPALLLAVMKAESSFNPIVVSKAGAVGLMQLVPETAIRHGVRNLYDTDDNVIGGAKHLRYLIDRFHGNIRLALAAYNAGEGKVDLYGQIPPYKETQDYVKKVLVYYRNYKKDGWMIPVIVATPSMHTGRPY